MRKGEANGMPLFFLVYNPIIVVILAWKELIVFCEVGVLPLQDKCEF